MSQFDAAATPMIAAFNDKRSDVPYRALQPKQSLSERNTRESYRARDAEKLALERADEADEQTLNIILWHAIKGAKVPLPPTRTSFRTPLGHDEDD